MQLSNAYLFPIAYTVLDVKDMLNLCAGDIVNEISSIFAIFEILTKWFSSTRLETRTKESNIYASVWVANPSAE